MSEVFAVLPGGRRTWAVGAIHGEAAKLRTLHARLVDLIAPEDNLVYLGNLLGRGADVIGTVQDLLLFRRALMAAQTIEAPGAIVYLRGRQEEMWHKLLQVQFAPDPRGVLEWMLAQGIGPTLHAYGGTPEEGRRAAAMGAAALSQWTNRLRAAMRSLDGHDRLINVLKRAAYVEDNSLLFVNAGVDATRPLSEQADSFWWGGQDFEAIEAGYGGFRRIVRGYDQRHRGLWSSDAAVSLDGGCGFGGSLAAACFAPNGSQMQSIEV